MKEEIVAGIRNALERGQTLDQAVRSFINAGYHPNEVSEAAQSFSGASNIVVEGQPLSDQSTVNSSGQQIPIQGDHVQTQVGEIVPKQTYGTNISPEKKSGHGLAIFLVILLIILGGVLVASLLFKTQILTFLHNFGA